MMKRNSVLYNGKLKSYLNKLFGKNMMAFNDGIGLRGHLKIFEVDNKNKSKLVLSKEA